MSYDLAYIKKLRVKLGISQKELANQCSISASMLNQIEKGTAKPGFDTAKTIFNYLETKKYSNQKKAGEICTKPIFSLAKSDTLGMAIDEMKDHGFSQIPIFSGKKCIGIVTESGIIRYVDNPNYPRSTRLSKMLEPIPPIFSSDFPASSLKSIIGISGCILVSGTSGIIGIITSQDLLKLI
jgi:predicted transcriptional regulator